MQHPLSIRQIKAEDLESYCSGYGIALAQTIRESFPAIDGVHLVPGSEWFRLARSVRKTIGLGDIVHAIAQPIARAIDVVAHTDLQNCGGCKKRREMLNRIHL